MSDCSGASYAHVVGRVIAHDVHHRDPGSPCVVEIREPVAETRPEVQQTSPRAHPPSAHSHRRRRSRRPRTGSAPPASRGSSPARRRSGSPRCPGFVKQVVTPASTSVRIRAWAPLGMRAPYRGPGSQSQSASGLRLRRRPPDSERVDDARAEEQRHRDQQPVAQRNPRGGDRSRRSRRGRPFPR